MVYWFAREEEEDLTCLLELTSRVETLNDLCSEETVRRGEAVDD